MSIQTKEELAAMKRIGQIVGSVLKSMTAYAQPGMTTLELDNYGYELLKKEGARSAPKVMYNFPGYTCIGVNAVAAHGIPSDKVVLKEGDLVNIDVSAELDGFFSDNGGSFILGPDIQKLNPLVETSKRALMKAINQIKTGKKISEFGRIVEMEARHNGFKVLKNLVGHGIGRALHEAPHEIPSYYDKHSNARFKKNMVVAVETFISTKSQYVYEQSDGWTMMAKDGSFVAQHEHTIMVTDGAPVILTSSNGIRL